MPHNQIIVPRVKSEMESLLVPKTKCDISRKSTFNLFRYANLKTLKILNIRELLMLAARIY